MPTPVPPSVERIEAQGKLLGLIVRAAPSPERTTFLTENSLPFQAGFVVYPKGGAVVPHVHHPVERCLSSTCEALLVRQGSCWVDFYDDQRRLSESRRLGQGDLVILYEGGHGVRMPDEDCVLFEIKQGPYPGIDEKERFNP
ncbi:MAG: hypothetical protein EPN26_16695 [Rhodospirillales bacterium]|nr:MAG: hypothetical protein EPN26_16695 [Rhodospirillales bacterium]